MNDEIKKLVEALRDDAEWAHANEWETPITLGDHLDEAANLIEQLSAQLVNQATEYSVALKKTTEQRDAAIEQVKTLSDCKGCKHDELCKGLFPDCSECENLQCPCHSCNADGRNNWEWRGVKEDNK